MKKCVALLMAFSLLFSVTACNNASSVPSENYGSLADSVVWGVPATEKVLRDVHGIYDSVRTDAKLDILSARGEYEGGQIIITAKDKKLKYDVSVGDLKSADGDLFPAANVDVCHEAYVTVSQIFDTQGTSVPGKYPDALLPFGAVKELGENVVQPGENQGIYFRFYVPLDQKAGVYLGTYTVTIGENSMKIPVRLTVADVEVSPVNHTKSIFSVKRFFARGELDTTQEMYDKYTQFMFEYRLNPQDIIYDTNHSDEDIKFYVETAYRFMQNEKCGNLCIPYATASVNGQVCFAPGVMDKYLTAIAEKSFETGFNMFEKEMCYFAIIDEPAANNLLERVKVVMSTFKQTLNATTDRLEGDASITASNKAEVIESLRNIKNVITAPYAESYRESVDNNGIWCPAFSDYDSEEERSQYAYQDEQWWYGCMNPRIPYPTYHTEDSLISARAVGWMQAEYGVTGNLLWCVNGYGNNAANKGFQEIEEYYEGNASRFPNTNGDGYLLYPGKKYGVDGPIASMRLEAIRDGYEDFELLYALKNDYKAMESLLETSGVQAKIDADKTVRSLTEGLYSGTQVFSSTEKFSAARNALLQLCVLNAGEAEFYLADYSDDGYGKKTYRFLADSAAVVQGENGVLTSDATITVPVDGGSKKYKTYTVTQTLEDEVNTLSLTVTANGTEYVYRQYLGGKVRVTKAESFSESDFTAENVQPGYQLTEASELDGSLTGKAVKITLPATDAFTDPEARKEQSFRFGGSAPASIGADTDRTVLHIWYEGEDNPEFAVFSKHKNNRIYLENISTKLHKGLNEIVMPFGVKNWNKLGALEYFVFTIGDSETGSPERGLYFMDMVIHNK